jgi:hypothetical protein
MKIIPPMMGLASAVISNSIGVQVVALAVALNAAGVDIVGGWQFGDHAGRTVVRFNRSSLG